MTAYMNINKIFTLLLALCTTAAHAQFTDVEWPAGKHDTVIPVCTSVIALPADYHSYSYSAHVEYPEYIPMTKEEIARYSIAEKHGMLPKEPAVECHIGIQAKRAQLDMAFLPIVMRNGKYYRINSYKLVVSRKPLPKTQKAASRSSAERYAAQSVLSSGKWVRISVEKDGIHKITDKELKKMGFSNPAKVRLYGYGGHILPEKDIHTLIDDLCEVPLLRETGHMLFYANGTVKWEYSSGKFAHSQNVYSTKGYYFLTESEDEPAALPAASHEATTNERITEFTDYALYENEAKSLCSYGRVLVDDKDYSQGRTKSYKIAAPGIVGGNGTLTLSFATNGVASSNVTVAAGGKNAGSLAISKTVSGEVGKIAEKSFTVREGLEEESTITLTHNVTDNSTTGFLDYISINYTRKLELSGSETHFRGNSASGYALFEIAGCSSGTHVWDVTDPAAIKELKGTLEGSTYKVVAPASRTSRLVVFNANGTFPAVEQAGEVANQNLHGLGQTDMVIIVPSNGKFMNAAKQLAEAHKLYDGLTVEIINAQHIYNEFSSGTPDVTAYRRLMKMLYDRASTPEEAPKYLLLLGDSWYDNRMITFPGRKQEDYLLCYESKNSVDAIHSYVLEDYMGYLDDSEGGSHLRDKVDIGIGRIPAQTAAEANAVVAKTIEYMRNSSAGEWQNIITLLGDDGDKTMPNQHMKDADSIASVVERNAPAYILDRIYWDDFAGERAAIGMRYPDVTQAIYDRLEKGCLIMNYSGHGSTNLLSHELAWKAADMAAVKSTRIPFWVTASCDIGPFDMGNNSVAEAAILNPDGAAIGLFTTTRTVMQSYNSVINKAFMRELLSPLKSGETLAVGDAVRRSKCSVISLGSDPSENKLQFILLGDPALRLKLPEHRLVVDKFNNAAAGTETQISAGGMLTIEGHVEDRSGNILDDFDGTLYSTLFDNAEEVHTRDNSNLGKHTYTAYNKRLFSGNDSIKNGRFTITFPIPMDINYSNEKGMLSLFAVDSARTRSAQGRFDNFTVGGTAKETSNDGQGPEIALYLNTPDFVDGDEVNSAPCLWVELYDENGINTIGTGIGHDITAIIDNSPSHTYNLNHAFTPETGDYRRGKVMMPLKQLEAGEHTLLLRAWDLYNNSSVKKVMFIVNPGIAPGISGLRLASSPVIQGTPTYFEVTHNRPQSELEVTIEIFTMQGQILYRGTQAGSGNGNIFHFEWNGTAQGGQTLPTGVYLARACIVSDNAESSTKTIKVVVVNNK